MPQFLLRAWAERLLFDCRDYRVTADTLGEAAELLIQANENVQESSHSKRFPGIVARELGHMDAVRILEPCESVEAYAGITEVDENGDRLRDLLGVPTGCVRLGEPLEPDPVVAAPRLWVLHISHKHGDSYWVFDDSDKAHSRLAEWARYWWDKDGPRDELAQTVPMPEEDAEVVEEYFNSQDNECWSIEETGLNEG